MSAFSEYERFENASPARRRLLRQEELSLEITDLICKFMEEEGINRAELASKLNKTRGFVSQALSGRRNLTLRTLADIVDALGCRLRADLVRRHSKGCVIYTGTWQTHEFSIVGETVESPDSVAGGG